MNTSPFQKFMRILLGLLMVLAGIGHLTFQREEFHEKNLTSLLKNDEYPQIRMPQVN
ncbi:hypothetical protein MM236_03395 [Belliella sp. DSM 107340]|uniref:Uncharacterized protein n=1 Tax=Belliella calami TaxID=2923436 RepID=A0ABS9UL93_9BACT|nr:hypothetical protein [Belliella calami]MCH7397013.1 hypothetical protein [Belliella calami]